MVAFDAGEGAGVPGSAQWWYDRQRRPVRRRSRPDGLSIERIIKAAIAVVDADGLEALTVRRLAEDFATGSASLYRHFASRDELLVLLVDHVLGDVRLPAEDLAPRQKVEWMAQEFRRVLVSHANLVPALATLPLLGPNAMRGSKAALTYLWEAGWGPRTSVQVYFGLVEFVLGTVFFDTSTTGRRAMDTSARADLLAELPTDGFPLLGSYLQEPSYPSPDEVFAFGLTAFLDGVELRYPREH
jgi:AcrR family transcriptional regulator